MYPYLNLPYWIGKYELVEHLSNSTGYRPVYRAMDTVLGRTVAVRLLDHYSSDPEMRVRFLFGARVTSQLCHPNIVKIYDYGAYRDFHFVVQEFLDGQDLCTLMHERKEEYYSNNNSNLCLCIDIANAVEYIHSQQIIHRGLSPAEVFLTSTGQVKLMDLYIAKFQDFSITRSKFTIGRPSYMAPEQLLGKPVTPQSDVWAFGLILYELFTGCRAFDGELIENIFLAILTQPLDLKSARLERVPRRLVTLIADCTHKDPALRIGSFSQVRSELQRVLQDQQQPAPFVTAVGKRGVWWRRIYQR